MSTTFSWRIPTFPGRFPSKRVVYAARYLRFDSCLLVLDCLDLNKQKKQLYGQRISRTVFLQSLTRMSWSPVQTPVNPSSVQNGRYIFEPN